jgi:kinesin family protein 4/21/27
MATNIQVAIRIRPFLPFESGSKSCIDVLSSTGASSPIGNAVKLHHHNHKDGHTFTFDKCYGGSVTQVEVYQEVVVPLLRSCLEGYNATTLAYGQTGAGELRGDWMKRFVFCDDFVLLLLSLLELHKW